MNKRQVAISRTISEHERFRRLRGLTVTELAEAIGRSRPWVSQVENGRVEPSAEYRRDVARVLRVPEELIFGEARSNGSGDPEKGTPAAA